MSMGPERPREKIPGRQEMREFLPGTMPDPQRVGPAFKKNNKGVDTHGRFRTTHGGKIRRPRTR